MRLLRSALSAVALLAIVVGVPMLLLPIIGDIGQVWSTLLSGDVPNSVLLSVLAQVGMLVWIQFVIAVVVELASGLKRSPEPRRIPGVFKGQQMGARVLVTGLLMLSPSVLAAPAAFAASIPDAPAAAVAEYGATQAIAPASATRTAVTAAEVETTTVTITEDGPQMWWDLAEEYLGDGARWSELWELNEGRPEPGGARLASPGPLKPGWTVLVPASAVSGAEVAAEAPDSSFAPPPASAAAPVVEATEPAPVEAPAPSAGAVSATQVTVEAGDTLSALAAEHLGDATRYPEIAQASGISNPNELAIGQILSIPADAGAVQADPTPTVPIGTVTVQAGDTLTALAAEHLGDAARYPEIAQASGIANADDLVVGQSLTIPADTGRHAAPDATVVERAAAEEAAAEQAAAERAAAEQAAAEQAAAEQAAAEQAAAEQAAAAVVSEAASDVAKELAADISAVMPKAPAPTAPSAAAPAPSVVDQAAAEQTEESDAGWVVDAGVLVAAGAALAGSVLAGLRVARRRRATQRLRHQVPAPQSLPLVKVERELSQKAAGAADVQWMDQALRYAAAAATEQGLELPDVICVWLSHGELQLQLAIAAPAPAPFVAEDDSWILEAGTQLELPDGQSWTDLAAPFPALASIGECDGEMVLVDLERMGSVTLAGEADRTEALLRHLAAELAHSLWSDALQVTVVGWGQDLPALDPDRVRHLSSVQQVLVALRARVDEAEQARAEGDSVLQGRVDGDEWVPEVYLVDAAAGSVVELAELESVMARVQGRSAVAVVARGPAEGAGGTVLHIDEVGMLGTEVLGPLQVTAAGLSTQDLADLTFLFGSVGQYAEAPQPLEVDEPWAESMDSTGSLIVEQPAVDAGAEVGELEEGLQDPAGDIVVGQNQVVVPIRPVPSPAAVAALASALAADPTLDADLAEWYRTPEVQETAEDRRPTPWVGVPRISVLGEPQIVTNGVMPRDQIALYTEIVVYLALHAEVRPAQLAEDLWPPATRPGAKSLTPYVSHARAWLGVDEDGKKFLSEARAGRGYRMQRLLDVELFRRLKKRADARLGAGDVEGGREDLRAALQLVQGPAMDRTGDGYSWLYSDSDPHQMEIVPAMVIGASHLLVELALEINDLNLAREAADVGSRIDPNDLYPRADHLQIAHRAGDLAAAKGWAQSILTKLEVQRIEDIKVYDIYRVVDSIFPRGLQAGAQASGM